MDTSRDVVKTAHIDSLAPKRSPMDAPTVKVPDGAGLATPPAVSIRASACMALPRALPLRVAAKDCISAAVVCTISASVTGRPARARA